MASKAGGKSSATRGNVIINELWANPSEENWKKAKAKILKEGKYYFTFYPEEIQGSMNLKSAYAIIYNKGAKVLYRVPVIKKTGKGIGGATIYLKGLEINRGLIKG